MDNCIYTFYDEDGTTVLKQEEASVGTVITPPDAPTKAGYVFKEWQGYTEGMTLSEDVSFTAVYTVNFESCYEYTVKDGKATIVGLFYVPVSDMVVPDTLGGYPVTAIWDEVFSYRSNITSVDIAAGVSYIDTFAFAQCLKLQTVTFRGNSTLTSIGGGIFWGCESLTSIEIPASVTSIEGNAFSQCPNLSSLTVAEGNTVYHSKDNYIIETASKTLVVGRRDGVIPADGSVTSIGDSAFSGCGFTSVDIPSAVVSLASDAFFGCEELLSIRIPASVTSIGAGAFQCNNKLATVYYGGTRTAWDAISSGDKFSDPTYYGATLICSCTYTFYDMDGTTVLKRETAYEGTAITAPTAPAKDGYAFSKWQGYTEGMTLSTDVAFTAVYKATRPHLFIDFANLSFRDAICIKYAVKVEGTTLVPKMLIWREAQEEYTLENAQAVLKTVGTTGIGGIRYRVFDYTGIAAKEMGDVVYARAYVEVDGVVYYSDVQKYSVLDYIYSIIGKTGTASTDEEYLTFMKRLLDYGEIAQMYFDYKEDRLVTDNFYQVKLVGGTFTDGCDHGLYLKDEAVTLIALLTNAEGEAFSYWVDSEGNVVSTDGAYTVGEANIVLTAIYGDLEDDDDQSGAWTPLG